MRTRHGLILRLAMVAMTCGLMTDFARADNFHGINAGAVVYGGMQFTEAKAAAIAATGTNAIRINFRLDWQTNRSSWSGSLLTDYDTIIDRANRYGLEVLGLFSNETVWLGQSDWNMPPDSNGMNAYVYTFADTAYFLIDHYKNDIKRWEVWNEPNCWSSSDPSYNDPRYVGCTYILPAVYANLLAETYKECNYYDGRSLLDDYGITLCTGGLLAHDPWGFSHAMDYMLQVYNQPNVWNSFEQLTGRRYPWDWFGYHLYISGDDPVATSQIDNYLNAVRSNKNSKNDSTTILMTEFGWRTASCGDATQALNLQRSFDHFEAQPDVDGLWWYQWTDEAWPNEWGITRMDGSLKPSYYEFVQQNTDGIAGDPVVTIAANDTTINTGDTVTFTPSVTYDGTATFSTGKWYVETQPIVTVTGTLNTYAYTFNNSGSFDVHLNVTDSNNRTGISNTITIQVTEIPYAPVDTDRDGDVDQSDFGAFQLCLGDIGNTACDWARLDDDNDVDSVDLGIFQACMTAPGVAADLNCAD